MNPCFGREHWENCMQLGVRCFEQGQFEQAAEFLGASYEVASISIDGMVPAPAAGGEGGLTPYDRFVLSGHGLAECYRRLDDRKHERHFLLATHFELMSSYREQRGYHPTLHRLVEISLRMLHRHYRHYDDADRIRPHYERDLAFWQWRNMATLH